MNRIREIAALIAVVLLVGCGGDGSSPVPTERGVEVPDHFLQFLNDQQGKVLSEAWSKAYYRAVDPKGKRTTLEGWKKANDFDSCDRKVHVIFRDAKDLGYGRNMQACQHNDGRLAVFVDNYVVRIQPGDPSNYGPINVEAAIAEDRNHMQGTNAIEFTPINPNDPTSDKVAKFFTFTEDGQLNLAADLDGRGDKPMPQPCLLCHGATLLPLDIDDIMASKTPWAERGVEKMLKSAKMNLLELDSFDYSPYASGYSREDQEEALRRLNGFIFATFQESQQRSGTDPGHWQADFAIEVAEKRYKNRIGTRGQRYQDDAVPCGWRSNPVADMDCADSTDLPVDFRPEGVELLYREVIDPHCIACHSLRGSSTGERLSMEGNAINFSNYEKFIGYSDLIVDYVYHRGVMPLSLRNYEKFWQDRCDGPPALLAIFLPEFDRYDNDGCVVTPGLPVAKPGVNRLVKPPATLDAGASLYVREWQWEVLSKPAGAVATFSDEKSAAPVFRADTDGTYVLRLTVTNLRGSHSQDLTLTVDSLMLSPKRLTFVDHVLPVLRDVTYPGRGDRCTTCHLVSPPPTYAGIPVGYDALNDRLYRDVLERVDLRDPENSMLLRKPTRDQHGGGKVIDRQTTDGEALYQMLINWIRNGAPCGDDPAICG